MKTNMFKVKKVNRNNIEYLLIQSFTVEFSGEDVKLSYNKPLGILAREADLIENNVVKSIDVNVHFKNRIVFLPNFDHDENEIISCRVFYSFANAIKELSKDIIFDDYEYTLNIAKELDEEFNEEKE